MRDKFLRFLPVMAWLTLPVGVLLYSAIVSPYLRRPAVDFTSAHTQGSAMQGAAGEWSAFSLQWERRREGCVLNTASLSIVLIDGRGLAYTVGSQRGGIPLTYRDKRGTVDMPFRVPEKVPLGTATLLVSAPFQCGRWPTESARARYSFEVVHRDE